MKCHFIPWMNESPLNILRMHRRKRLVVVHYPDRHTKLKSMAVQADSSMCLIRIIFPTVSHAVCHTVLLTDIMSPFVGYYDSMQAEIKNPRR